MSRFFLITPVDPANPGPTADELLQFQEYLQEKGYNLGEGDEEAYLMERAGSMIRKHGVTECVAHFLVTEEVLPDATPPRVLADTLRYKLKMMAPTAELLLIDTYLFPDNPDADYLSLLKTVLNDALQAVSELKLVTSSQRNTKLEGAFMQMVKGINPALSVQIKHSKVFHDRFWIADKDRGIFVGTSLNGIGNRYAVVDYLRQEDAKAIYARYQAL